MKSPEFCVTSGENGLTKVVVIDSKRKIKAFQFPTQQTEVNSDNSELRYCQL